MGDAIAHRGPDASGIWTDDAFGLALSHRRLSIVDLSEAGAQPMVSADGRWVICYNGEIYNSDDIRRDPAMRAVAWRGHSDTETIVESVARRGLNATLDDLNGMFAIALWDRKEHSLHLIRDRLGIKPLFVARRGDQIFFASELKSFHAAQAFSFEIEPASVASFLRFGYVPAPHSIYRGVEKLMPGEHATLSIGGIYSSRRYWSAADTARRGVTSLLEISDEEAIAQLSTLLADAVSRQMLADVPLGAFLSGGIDSSAVAGLMVAAKRGAVRTFSIGFPEFGFDESKDAAAVARHLGTEHTELVVTASDALGVVPQLAQMYDEPFADSSQIPTHLVSKLTRRHVTVALSGDGGDELFGGYNRYRLAEGMSQNLARVPLGVRRATAGVLNAVPMGWVDGVASLAPRGMLPSQTADKLRKFASVMTLDPEGIYRRLVSQCENPAELAPLADEHPLTSWSTGALPTFLDRMQLLDTMTYLPDDILQKVDRASMAVALEARPPLLDHRVVEFAWRLPRHFKIRDGETKWLLRRVTEQMVPRHLLDRPKMGFGIPLAEWLRGPLREWAEDLLDPQRLGAGFIDVTAARRLWADHLTGRRNWAYALWTILMFEAWRRRWASV
ncbi:asparagine synthase (glutamine-hydrolyzing) [Afipia massiliensis]|uniref:asparagine synthase (glutamine-hydrolyzing) n=2 Tax=Afipia massiliensis TaxID=211460 RepID=A0A840N951_9BRAD|nr:asparagine synthase (glutamine-hydrolyzing) [Afipia massiliensis]